MQRSTRPGEKIRWPIFRSLEGFTERSKLHGEEDSARGYFDDGFISRCNCSATTWQISRGAGDLSRYMQSDRDLLWNLFLLQGSMRQRASAGGKACGPVSSTNLFGSG